MKKTLLLIIISLVHLQNFAQIKDFYPKGFKNGQSTANYKPGLISNVGNSGFDEELNNPPYRLSQSALLNSAVTVIIGATKFDLQTYRSVLNNFSVNSDGSVSACYNFSPDANTSSNPPYPFRGTGYNYLDPNGWSFPYPQIYNSIGPSTGDPRSGWPNIVVTPSGKELLFQYANTSGNPHNYISMHSRPVKGTGPWTTNQTFWNTTSNYLFPRACGGVINENVYVIWLNDSGGVAELFFSMSANGGVTWTPEVTIPQLSNYLTFIPDCYSIDAHSDTVAISIGYEFTDVILLKSFDGGANWSKTIIQKHPMPQFSACACSTNYIQDGIPIDTIRSNGGDSKVLIDNNGMCHVWFSALDYYADTSGAVFTNTHTDNLFYWNESMGADTTTVWNSFTGGNGSYVAIARAEDFNGNGIIDLPSPNLPTCTEDLGEYGMGMTQTPSAGIDANGKIYLCYSTVNELADTTVSNLARRHVFLMKLEYPYNPANWSYPENIIPSISAGGDGENEECVYPSMSRRVLNDTAYIMYQQDLIPGISMYLPGSCQANYNLNHFSYRSVWGSVVFTNNTSFLSPAINPIPYPNPCKTEFIIPYHTKNKLNVNITLSDITGKVIEEISESCKTGFNQIKVSTKNLSGGIYFCTINSNNEKSTHKIIVE